MDSSEVKSTTLRLIRSVLPASGRLGVRLWDGTTLTTDGERPEATLVLAHEDSLARMLEPPVDLSTGEAYVRGDFDVEGDLEAAFALVGNLNPKLGVFDWSRLIKDAAALRRRRRRKAPTVHARVAGRRHSKERDQQAIRHHYDVSNDFYRLWLDERMVYSCGYFPTGEETLDEAQEAKLELICRKLRLRPQERLLDIGCGWGGLALYAAERGAQVTGITIAAQQIEEARRRAASAGALADGVRFELLDYRDAQRRYDKIVSVGMAEHVGAEQLPNYFRKAHEQLEPGGLMLNHAISRGPRPITGSREVVSGEFIQRYVFPDGEIVPLWQSLKAAEEVGFEVRDVEDLREHYAQTLRCWRRNLESAWEGAVAEVGVERARLWRLFLAGCAHAFDHGHVALHQALLAKPDAHGGVRLPRSRADLYA